MAAIVRLCMRATGMTPDPPRRPARGPHPLRCLLSSPFRDDDAKSPSLLDSNQRIHTGTTSFFMRKTRLLLIINQSSSLEILDVSKSNLAYISSAFLSTKRFPPAPRAAIHAQNGNRLAVLDCVIPSSLQASDFNYAWILLMPPQLCLPNYAYPRKTW